MTNDRLDKITRIVFGIAWIFYSFYYCQSYYQYHSTYSWLDHDFCYGEPHDATYWSLQILLAVWSIILCLLFCSFPRILKRTYMFVRGRMFRNEKRRRWALRTKWAMQKKLNISKFINWIAISFVVLSLYTAGLLFIYFHSNISGTLIPFGRVSLVGYLLLFVIIPWPYVLDYWFHRRNLWGFIIAVTVMLYPIACEFSTYDMVHKKAMTTPQDVCLYAYLLLCIITVVRVVWNFLTSTRFSKRFIYGTLATLVLLITGITVTHKMHMGEVKRCLAKYNEYALYNEPRVVSIADKKTIFQWSIWRVDNVVGCFRYGEPDGLILLIVFKDNFIHISLEGEPHIWLKPIKWNGKYGAVCFGNMPSPIAKPNGFSPMPRTTTTMHYKRLY